MIDSNPHTQHNIENLLNAFNKNNEGDIREIIKGLTNLELAKFIEIADPEHIKYFCSKFINGEILTYLPAEIRSEVLIIIGEKKYANLIVELDVEDILVVIQDLEPEKQNVVLSLLDNSEVKEILQELLSYPEESAGRLIHKDFIVIPENWTVNQAVEFIRLKRNIPEHHNQLFVVNHKMQPVGKIELSDILFSKKYTKVKEKMHTELNLITTDLDQEAVADIFRQHDLISTAVVNDNGEIVGLISADDIVDVVTKEAEEDILHLGGLSSTDITNTITQTILKRIPWLLVTFLAINLASFVVGIFDKVLIQSVELAILMPIIAAMGGNAGVQASTIAVSAIATKKLNNINTSKLIFKELLIGFANGVILSSLTVLIISVRFHSVNIEIIFSLSMIIVFSIATFVGSAIPILLNKMGFDPALSSSIVTSAITDLLGFATLLSIASLLLS